TPGAPGKVSAGAGGAAEAGKARTAEKKAAAASAYNFISISNPMSRRGESLPHPRFAMAWLCVRIWRAVIAEVKKFCRPRGSLDDRRQISKKAGCACWLQDPATT
ncbi:hypothetical protein, partial [Rhizobium sp. PEPV16]|uniref:hypothetical protein n=1 Tax=Rhizobium sp. PEPV16 TaxID=1820614 RepID=UPI001FEE1CD5